ncbi:MAG: hypothetical protein ACRDY0_03100 [Acidimicrobiales bacterium]
MAPERSLLDQALDLVVYAPVGFVVTLVDELPGWATKGRERLSQRAATARVVGQFVVADGRRRLRASAFPPAPRAAPEPAVPDHGLEGGLGSAAEVAGPVPGDHRPPAAAPAARTPRTRSPGRSDHAAGTRPAGAHLAIPGYDSLSASQVVQRLASLAPSELEAVRLYEEATRGRRTILARVSQLQRV